MEFGLDCVSPAGAHFVELADKHAAEFALTAGRHDRDNSFPFDNWAAMRRSGFLSAAVPKDLGGLGVTAVADLLAGINRLARGDAAVAIGAAMHTTAFWYVARLLGATARPGDASLVDRMRLLLRACARGRVIACVGISERGTSLGWPRTTATPDGDRYGIDGTKVFCTNSPAATLFLISVRIRTGDGADRLGFALVPRDTAGLTVLQNWDALGMRASGSGDVVFGGCLLPSTMVMAAGPLGVLSATLLPLTMVGALVLAGAFLGIAEQAQEAATDAARRRPGGAERAAPADRGSVQALVGENEIELAASRAMLGRTAGLLDERLTAAGDGLAPAELHGLMKEVQCASVATRRAAVATVDRAMTISGGAGYLSSHPLSRLYRDVRAGPFMQPFSALDAYEYIGKVRLGVDPDSKG